MAACLSLTLIGSLIGNTACVSTLKVIIQNRHRCLREHSPLPVVALGCSLGNEVPPAIASAAGLIASS